MTSGFTPIQAPIDVATPHPPKRVSNPKELHLKLTLWLRPPLPHFQTFYSLYTHSLACWFMLLSTLEKCLVSQFNRVEKLCLLFQWIYFSICFWILHLTASSRNFALYKLFPKCGRISFFSCYFSMSENRTCVSLMILASSLKAKDHLLSKLSILTWKVTL